MVEFQLQLSEGLWLREEAVSRVRSKYRVWVDRVGAPALYSLCRKQEFFTTDDLWALLPNDSGVERRVMGALMLGFSRKGYIQKTSFTEKSSMPRCHARDKAVWKSLLYEGGKE